MGKKNEDSLGLMLTRVKGRWVCPSSLEDKPQKQSHQTGETGVSLYRSEYIKSRRLKEWNFILSSVLFIESKLFEPNIGTLLFFSKLLKQFFNWITILFFNLKIYAYFQSMSVYKIYHNEEKEKNS